MINCWCSNALTLKIWKLCGRLGLVAHENATKGWGLLQLLKAYNTAKMPPYVAIQVQCPQVPTILPLRDWLYLHQQHVGYYSLFCNALNAQYH